MKLNTDEWIYAVLLLSSAVFWVGYKVVIQPIQNEDKAIPALIERVEQPKPAFVSVYLAVAAPVVQETPAPRKLTPVQERLLKAGFDPFTVHPVSVK